MRTYLAFSGRLTGCGHEGMRNSNTSRKLQTRPPSPGAWPPLLGRALPVSRKGLWQRLA